MSISADRSSHESEIDIKALAQLVARYRKPSRTRSVFELGVTVGALALLWAAMWASLYVGYWLTLLLAIPAAGFLVRVFLIQHDCGHGAFFHERATNDWVGRVLGVLTFTPYDVWRHAHASHHATTGNLDRRGLGDIETLTVGEYRARSWLGRVAYRLYRNPVIMFGVGPAYVFILQHRIPWGMMRKGWRPWLSSIATNAAIASAVVGMMFLVGPWQFTIIHLPILLLAASIGVWLFYVQHQFEHTMWVRNENWRPAEAALYGSSYYELPKVLQWLTANIGMHHIHHLCSRIPYYRLPQVLRAHPPLQRVGRVTLLQSIHNVRLTLWDETRQRLIPFRGLKQTETEA